MGKPADQENYNQRNSMTGQKVTQFVAPPPLAGDYFKQKTARNYTGGLIFKTLVYSVTTIVPTI
jgi:hypothetical protein